MPASVRATLVLALTIFLTACSAGRGNSVVQGDVLVVPEGAAACNGFEVFASEASALEKYKPSQIAHMEKNRLIEIPGYQGFSSSEAAGDLNESIQAVLAANGLASSSGVKVAVIDSGVDVDHPDLINWIDVNTAEIDGNAVDDDGNGFVDDVVGWSFAPNTGTSDFLDDNGHGTHVSGIVKNALTEGGMNSSQVTLVPIRFLDANAQGTLEGALRSIGYAISRGVHVINASWGSTSYSPLLDECVKGAMDAGIVFVAAAGNASSNNDTLTVFPANTGGVISVAAMDGSDLAGFSNYGPQSVDIAAQGEGIYSTLPGGDYGYMSGTSMASPYVAGVAAVLFDSEPDSFLVKSALINGATARGSLSGLISSGSEVSLSGALGEL